MRVTGVRTVGLAGHTPPAGWDNDIDEDENQQTIILVDTDEGLTGVGAVYTSKALVDAALRLLEPWLLGEIALEPARVSEKLHQMSFWQGRGGAVTHTVSGLDIALWDLFGKACRQPVSRLLAGRHRDRVRAYASVLFHPVESLGSRLEECLGRGFRAVKVGWRPFGRVDDETDERLVRLARQVVGADVDIMVDAGGSEQFWHHKGVWALRTAKVLEQYNVRWFEEPLSPDDVAGFRALRERSPVPITTGEVLTRRQSFQDLLDPPAVEMVQPDCTKVGGLSEMRRIAAAAEDRGVLFTPHGWNNAIGLVADLHMAASSTTTGMVEYVTPSAYMDSLLAEPIVLDGDGMLPVPDRPGLGVDLDTDALDHYAGLQPGG